MSWAGEHLALSGDVIPSITIRSEGIPSALHIANSVPGRLIPPAIRDTLDELLELGITLMAINVMNSIRTEKSTGALAESIQGSWEQTHGSPEVVAGTYEMEIGSALPHAEYASREIGLSVINRNVQVQPGRWRFIGIRPPIPKHPFLEQTLGDLHKAMPDMLSGYYYRYMGEVQREADTLIRAGLATVFGED